MTRPPAAESPDVAGAPPAPSSHAPGEPTAPTTPSPQVPDAPGEPPVQSPGASGEPTVPEGPGGSGAPSPQAPDVAGEPEELRGSAPLVVARGLSLRGARGWVYRDVDLSLAEGGLAVVSGEAGSGRTSLLLTLAGRMRPTSGGVTVAGRSAPSAIQRVAAIGETEGVNELDDALTVAEHVFERRHLRAGILPRRRTRRRDEVAAALSPAGLDVDPDTPVGDLGPRDRHLLGAALALMDRPLLLVLDDVDRGMRGDHQREMWTLLRALTEQAGVTIVAGCVDGAPAAGLADVEVAL
ncbi:ATP-binding cassette domain-containing protein [Actinoallomurus rhizosphaericola]|uniref:ATP-binding cassette domain-containing protein n=1 Tax=Actinoallomurus rhizosphaericola TaxID=2952536 RepID=UPI002091A5B8|nr:ATP-binding cassette domain-containing protein [Actinoallomurus rhizosphaericola]MCO5993830.1 ATP-binding cassette domain-containing protein [Actinoallomurus rhizosphaericola]